MLLYLLDCRHLALYIKKQKRSAWGGGNGYQKKTARYQSRKRENFDENGLNKEKKNAGDELRKMIDSFIVSQKPPFHLFCRDSFRIFL